MNKEEARNKLKERIEEIVKSHISEGVMWRDSTAQRIAEDIINEFSIRGKKKCPKK